jgi:4-amino-4-deoxy-L-arabinose transferase-like glycosyltransferase
VQDPSEVLYRQVVSHVLATHPEAPSLLSEVDHRRALAAQSTAEVTRLHGVMQAARMGYEELRHRLDPRRTRPVHFGIAMVLLAVVFTVLVMFDAVTFDGVLAADVTAAAVAASAAWLGCAWLAAVAAREEQRGLLAATIAGAAALGGLLAALHGEVGGRMPVDRPTRAGVGVAAVLLILILVAVAAMLMTRTEPASVLLARRRWQSCQSEYEAALRIQRSDAEAEAVARQSWRGLIQAHVQAPGNGDRKVIDRRG